jgi:hypothetical protein
VLSKVFFTWKCIKIFFFRFVFHFLYQHIKIIGNYLKKYQFDVFSSLTHFSNAPKCSWKCNTKHALSLQVQLSGKKKEFIFALSLQVQLSGKKKNLSLGL